MKFKRRFSAAERVEIVDKSQRCLWTDEGKPGLDYLRETRQLTDPTIRLFGLGYIPHDVRHQLAGRVIMPLYDPSGNLITVTTRAVQKSERLPDYWHEAYEKSFYLFGMNIAKETIRKWRFVILVEGQFDVLQLHEHGMSNTVGVCSTNLSDVQVAIIHRYCDQIVVIFDNDVVATQAGQKGTAKAMEWASKAAPLGSSQSQGDLSPRAKFKIDFVGLDGEPKDPDEYVKSYGIARLKRLIREKVQKMRQEYAY
jgi:DNA primase